MEPLTFDLGPAAVETVKLLGNPGFYETKFGMIFVPPSGQVSVQANEADALMELGFELVEGELPAEEAPKKKVKNAKPAAPKSPKGSEAPVEDTEETDQTPETEGGPPIEPAE